MNTHPNSVRKLGPLQVALLAIPCIAVLVVPWFNTLEPIVTPWAADQAYGRFQHAVRALDDARQITHSVLRWRKVEYLHAMDATFRHTRQFHLHATAAFDAEHLVGLAQTRGDVQSLFKLGLTPAAIGLDAFAADIRALMGEQARPAYWSWEGGLGIK